MMKLLKRPTIFMVILSALMQAAEKNTSSVTILKQFDLPYCQDISFLENNHVVAITHSKEKVITYAITIDSNRIKELSYEIPTRDNYFIATNSKKTKAVLPSNNTAIFIKHEESLCIPLTIYCRALFQDKHHILTISGQYQNTKCMQYDYLSKTYTEFPTLTQVISTMNKEIVTRFNYQIIKHPTKQIYALASLSNLAIYKKKKDKLKFFDLPHIRDKNMGQPYDIQYNCNGNYIIFTDPYRYDVWVVDFKNKEVFPIKKENEEYYSIDSKISHPSLPNIIVTLQQHTGTLRYWDIQKSKCLIEQLLPYTTNRNPDQGKKHFVSFSQNGKSLAIAISEKLLIVEVPLQVFTFQ